MPPDIKPDEVHVDLTGGSRISFRIRGFFRPSALPVRPEHSHFVATVSGSAGGHGAASMAGREHPRSTTLTQSSALMLARSQELSIVTGPLNAVDCRYA